MISQAGVQNVSPSTSPKSQKAGTFVAPCTQVVQLRVTFEARITQNVSDSRPSPPPQSTRAPLQEPNVPWPCEKQRKDVTHVSGQEAKYFTAKASGNYSYQRAIKDYTTLSDWPFQLVSIVTRTWSLQAHNEDIHNLLVIHNCWQYKTFFPPVVFPSLMTL
jgi:hypothetical protein